IRDLHVTGVQTCALPISIRSTPPDRIDFLHTVQCQCGIPYKNPGDDVREWDRKQGHTSLRIEAGSAIDPRTGEFAKLGLPYGERSEERRAGKGCRSQRTL